MKFRNVLFLVVIVAMLGLLACAPVPAPQTVIQTVEVEKEVIVEKEVVVEKEVIVEKEVEVEVVVTGHTHKPEVGRGEPLLVNPGELGGWLTGRASLAILDLESLDVRVLYLDQMEKGTE